MGAIPLFGNLQAMKSSLVSIWPMLQCGQKQEVGFGGQVYG